MHSILVVFLVAAALLIVAGGIAATAFGIERLRGSGNGAPGNAPPTLFYIAIMVLVVSAIIVFFYGR